MFHGVIQKIKVAQFFESRCSIVIQVDKNPVAFAVFFAHATNQVGTAGFEYVITVDNSAYADAAARLLRFATRRTHICCTCIMFTYGPVSWEICRT